MGTTQRLRQAFALSMLMVVSTCHAQQANDIIRTNELAHLQAALSILNMSERDLAFEKDVAEPQFALSEVRRMLEAPLALPSMGDRILAAVTDWEPDRVLTAVALLLECRPPAAAPTTQHAASGVTVAGLPPAIEAALLDFVQSAGQAQDLLAQAFARLSEDSRRFAVASRLAGLFNAEDHPDVRHALYGIGLSSNLVREVLLMDRDIDPEPGSRRYLDAVEKTDLAAMTAACRTFLRGVNRLREATADARRWPEAAVTLETLLGVIRIGSPQADLHDHEALLILDPGGDDVYTDRAGSVVGLKTPRLTAVVDLSGDDRYAGTGLAGPGTAIFGICVLVDDAGNDTFHALYTGQASALFGVSWIEDVAGDDVYRAYAHGQAAATCGTAVLHDAEGCDLYDIGLAGQGFAGVRGAALLVDEAGHDRYLAGGRMPDYERHDDRTLSLAQGFAIGVRPFAGGGIAALVDRSGNDTYSADVYGQGASYWYSAGFLLDMSGNDTYSVYHYGQGSGIHLSLGMLADSAGDDTYTGYILAQGNAHDYAVGMLLDHDGDDTYTADQHAQGRAINNSLALLIDSAGNDAYFARRPEESQGIGSNSARRDYGSLALLLDLAGKDTYTCDAANGTALVRPDVGMVYDACRARLRVPPERNEEEQP